MTLSLTESDPRPAEGEGYVADFHGASLRLAAIASTLSAHDRLWVLEIINKILNAMEK